MVLMSLWRTWRKGTVGTDSFENPDGQALTCTAACGFRDVSVTLFDAARTQVLEQQRPSADGRSLPRGRAVYRAEYPIVRAVLPDVSFGMSPAEVGGKPDWCLLWGNNAFYRNAATLADAIRTGAKIVICEDGFLRSADTWANHDAPPRFRHGCSLVLDALGCYCDATRESTVERLLNDPSLVVTEKQRVEARRLIGRIVGEKLTKYNHQPLVAAPVGRPGVRKVLVVDQSYGDYAVRKGWADDSTFARMLADAERDNPGADVLVKTHPDTMTGRRKGYYDGLKEHGNVVRVTAPVNPYALLEQVDEVYVCSTQFGFEALMAGKKVHVYGMPFYAGWGVTDDRQRNPRRTNRRSLEEIFYIFYVLYTHWYNPDTGKVCSIDEAMDWLIGIRSEYARFRQVGR